MLNRFRQLIGDLIRESVTRNCFQPWEIELLLDFQACPLRPHERRELLSGYLRAVERQFDKGADAPLRLSEFFLQRQARHSKS
jgi:hypothetical protein